MNNINKIALSTLAISIALASTSSMAETSYYDALVIESNPVYRSVEISAPHQECWQEEVVRNERRHQRRSRTPGLLGAVIGGAIGNAVGHHKGNQKVGAVVGAVLGGSIGGDIGRNRDSNRDYVVHHDTVEHCKTVYDYRQEEKLVGYNVLYSYNGGEYSVRMPRDPGSTVRIRVNVEAVL